MMTKPKIYRDGPNRWRNEKGEYHREDGPAIIHPNGSEFWYKNGKRHRVDGPAVIYGEEYWYVNGKLIDIKPILERFDVSPDWRNWTDAEKFLVRLALG